MGGTLDYREELAKQLKEDMAGAKYDTVYKLKKNNCFIQIFEVL